MKIKKEYQAAIFGIVSIILFIWGYNFLKGKDLLKSYNVYYSIFDNVEGIDNSTPVKMKGLVIGSISEMKFRTYDRKIVLTVNIDKSYFIPKDSKIKITGSGLLGAKNLEIELGNALEPAVSGDTLQSITDAGITELIGSSQQQIEELVFNTNRLIAKLNTTFNDQNQKNLAGSLENINRLTLRLNRLTEQINTTLAENKNLINRTLTSFNETGKNLTEITDKLAKSDYEKLIKNLTESTQILRNILLDLQQGKGSLGKLAKDEEMYNNLNKTLESLNALLEDMKAHPKRYVHFSVFGRKDKKEK
jgi:phospholipid/cholesterol/gamma-HCH transport system substrate-binding protein